MNTTDIRRLILLVIFSFSALMLWQKWQEYEAAHAPKLPSSTVPALPGSTDATAPKAASAAAGATPTPTPATAIASPSAGPVAPIGQTVTVKTDLLEVEINTHGGDIRRVTMQKQHSALDPTKPLTLMEPDPQHYFVTQTGLLGEGLPNHKSAYETDQTSYVLADGNDSVAVHLKAHSADGIEVTKTFTFKRDSYVVDIAYEVANKSDKPVSPFAYFQFLRDSNPPAQQAAPTASFGGVSVFAGPAVYTDESKYVKVTFKDVDNNKLNYPKKAKDGWIAIVQHYFVSAWLPKEGAEREYFTNRVADNLYTAGVVEPVGTIAPGGTATASVQAYIGPQETGRLEKFAPGFDLVVDYGWLKVLAVPIFTVLTWIHSGVGNWGWSIILLTIIIKLIFYPLNAKAGRSMAQMKVLAPKMEKLKEIYGEDRQKLNTAMMELYRTEKINPLGGCLPIVVQIPVFIALYWVLLASIELRHAPWLGWIQDLSAPDPYFILPVIYAVSMFVQTRLNPQPADPVQARVMLIMPIVFSVFFLFFPAGLVLYWVVQNMLSILQQWHINRVVEADSKKARA